VRDSATHHTTWRLMKFHEDIEPYRGREPEFYARFKPYEVIEGEGNVFTSAGVGLMLDLLMGAGGTVFSAANARVGVGDSSTAENASQTDLLGSNKLRKAMDATWPSRSGVVLSFQSSFGSTDANFTWNEWGIFNSASGATMFNRKAQSFGTKASGTTWALQIAISVT
jgi:hypothetical protein